MKTTSNPANRPRYALAWARGVVSEVQRRYPRATEIICQVYQKDTRDLVKLLASGDPEWHYMRSRIKYLHLAAERLGAWPDYYTVVEWCGVPRGLAGPYNYRLGLDEEDIHATLGERGSRGERGERAGSFQLPLPFSGRSLKPRVAPRERYLVKR